MFHLILPQRRFSSSHSCVLLTPDEVQDYDFTKAAEQIFNMLQVLHSANLLAECSHNSVESVLLTIKLLVADIDLDSDDEQESEYKHVRVSYKDEKLFVDLYVGV
jgi:hypothetical protein